MIGNDVLALNKYDSHLELRKLKPWSPAMFTASSFSILNYPTDIFDLLDADALCCVTSWKQVSPVEFLPEGIDKELGLPHGALLVGRRRPRRDAPARASADNSTAGGRPDKTTHCHRARAEPITTSVVAAADDDGPAYVAIAAGAEAMDLNRDDDDSGRVGSEMEVDGWCVGEVVF
ncbi:uncharacterized protein P884DRAFT_278171 [Thermothelomyces heterothallicus CBS 202.75]|uniref:uncharacterized protein n=1 Tax=Thermothelomyces heterothallicus CBS 202.75 TaxID=1149848 RepID=UPI0037430459